ncbi:hypothetical protein HPB50_009381 [Hyalomma asiaticum]|uniref:Uncharacterized protein n=1 Tax=Hyalomma asiaticum TaxID=266040 RepID=A0ACB7TH47_HYAAI|nr:hypothetical protein HPB50_009381 [Hyalomma asiaticum]
MEATPDALAISAVDIRLPPFWTADPQLRFLQVESQFTARRITGELTKYHHVVASLPPAIASEIRDLLVAPPAENAYTALKQLLIRRLTPSEPQRLQQLLHDTELGDRTPSQLLRHMRQLLHTDGATYTTDTDSRLLRELFLQRLPGNVRMILASAADKRLSELAELADSVLAVAPPSVAALQPDIAGRAPTTALHDIREQISRLADTVAAMQARSTPEERQPAADGAPEHALRPGFLATVGMAMSQGNKLGLGKCNKMISSYGNYQQSQAGALSLYTYINSA